MTITTPTHEIPGYDEILRKYYENFEAVPTLSAHTEQRIKMLGVGKLPLAHTGVDTPIEDPPVSPES